MQQAQAVFGLVHLSCRPSGSTARLLRRALLTAAAALLLLCQVNLFRAVLPDSLAGLADFRAMYSAGCIVGTGHAAQLYDYSYERDLQNEAAGPRKGALPFVYPPFAVLPFVPLSLLSYREAYFVLLLINLLLLGAAAAILSRRLPALVSLWRPLPLVLFLTFLPVGVALVQGQVSILLLLLCCGCYVSLQGGRPFRAGLLLAGMLIKFQIALPVALLFLAWRRWRFLGGFVLGAAVLACLSLLVAGAGGVAVYAHSLLSMAAGVSAPSEQARLGMFPSRMPNLHGVFYALSGGAAWGNGLTLVSSILVMLRTAAARASLPRALLAALLVSYHLQPHDLSLLLVPIAVLMEAALAPMSLQDGVRSRGRAISLRALAGGFAVALLLLAPVPLVLIARGLACLLAIPVAGILMGAEARAGLVASPH